MMEYAGVFFLYPSMDNGGSFLDSFKRAEPAAHDKWEYNTSGVVSNTVSKINDLVREFARPEIHGAASSASGLGSVSSSLSSLWSYGEGSGGIVLRKRKGKGKETETEKSKIIVKPGKLISIEGINYFSIQFSAPQLEGWSGIVKASVKSVLYGGGSDDIEMGEEGSPQLIGWYENEQSSGSQISIKNKALSNDIVYTIPQSYEGKSLYALFIAPTRYWAEFNVQDIDE
jgi:hypothetical protein